MRTLIQKIKFKALPGTLFEMYMDSKKHSLVTGGKAVINPKVGGSFSAYDGYIKGKNLMVIPDRMIVQSWRGAEWKKEDKDSTFILRFERSGKGSLVNMIHANVPDRLAAHLDKGWEKHYWKPWRNYLKTQGRS